MPRWFASLTHDVMDHPVHHLHPRIPCYRLRAAQAKFNELLGEHAIVEKYTLRSFLRALRTCKLYDFENHRWLDFDGKPTTGTTRMFRLTVKELRAEQMQDRGQRTHIDLLEAA
jgi:acyl-lipid omega-6 desaturase (Delta-12 desaturase)